MRTNSWFSIKNTYNKVFICYYIHMRTHNNDDLCHQLEEKKMDERTSIIVDKNWKDYLQIKDYVEFVATPSSWKFVVQKVRNIQEDWEEWFFEKPFAIIADLNYFEGFDLSHYQPWDMIEKKYLKKPTEEYLERFLNEFVRPFVLGTDN